MIYLIQGDTLSAAAEELRAHGANPGGEEITPSAIPQAVRDVYNTGVAEGRRSFMEKYQILQKIVAPYLTRR